MQNTIPCNRIQDRTIVKIWGKTEQQSPLLSYMYPKCIIVVPNDAFFAHNFLCNFILQKLRLADPKNSGKSVTTAPSFQRF